jgi:hypothetical protein
MQTMGDSLDDHESRVLAVVREVFDPLVERGAASVNVLPADGARGALIEITPSSSTACPLGIHVESPGDLDLFIGPHSLTTHIWEASEWKRGNFGALETMLREWLLALTEGRYEEEVRLTAGGETGKGRGTIGLPGGPLKFTYSNLQTLGDRGPWQRISYTPY